MIIKSHIRGGYRSVADYMKEQGQNEKTRVVELSDPSARNLDEAFHNMWIVASNTRCTKPLHHISINPMKDERLADKQVLAIVERCEEKYGYKTFHHQRVIVEHVKDGRQHFHVIWNRVSLMTGRPVWPGEHWKKSKQVCREMEKELGLKRPTPRRSLGKQSGKRKSVSTSIRKSTSVRGSRTRKSPLRTVTAKSSSARFTKSVSAKLNRIRSPKAAPSSQPTPFRPSTVKKGWPLAAVIDWASWGKANPRRFFALWPELSG